MFFYHDLKPILIQIEKKNSKTYAPKLSTHASVIKIIIPFNS